MYSLRIVLITGLGNFFGITYVNYAKRYMSVRQTEVFFEIALYSRLRVRATPYCAKSKINCTKQNILNSCRTILYPILCHGRRKCALGVSAHNDDQ